MAYEAKIILDSVNPYTEARLTTWELSYPRFVHSELMTHRVFSRNSASSRAIPVKKMIERVKNDPVFPVFWGKNQAGMQASVELNEWEREKAEALWLQARDSNISTVERMIAKECLRCESRGYGIDASRFDGPEVIHYTCYECKGSGKGLDLHKQIANRLLEPWMFITIILSATEFGNWFNLRHHKDAQPEIRKLAVMMAELYHSHQPQDRIEHIPMLREEELLWVGSLKKKVATARIARVSYLNHDGTKSIPEEDFKLHDRLADSGHWSPFEHVATAMQQPEWSGNFFSWFQYRKEFSNENKTNFNYEESCLTLNLK
jgi:thymidylate synthase ThyX